MVGLACLPVGAPVATGAPVVVLLVPAPVAVPLVPALAPVPVPVAGWSCALLIEHPPCASASLVTLSNSESTHRYNRGTSRTEGDFRRRAAAPSPWLGVSRCPDGRAPSPRRRSSRRLARCGPPAGGSRCGG